MDCAGDDEAERVRASSSGDVPSESIGYHLDLCVDKCGCPGI